MEIKAPNLTLALVAAAAFAGCGNAVAEQGGEERRADEVVLTPQAGAEGRVAAEQQDIEDRYSEAQAAEERGIELDDAEAREIVYGMPYEEWKSRHQAPDPAA